MQEGRRGTEPASPGENYCVGRKWKRTVDRDAVSNGFRTNLLKEGSDYLPLINRIHRPQRLTNIFRRDRTSAGEVNGFFSKYIIDTECVLVASISSGEDNKLRQKDQEPSLWETHMLGQTGQWPPRVFGILASRSPRAGLRPAPSRESKGTRNYARRRGVHPGHACFGTAAHFFQAICPGTSL